MNNPSQSTQKRKADDSSNPLANAAVKRPKPNASRPRAASAKPSLPNSQEMPGGLKIVRAPSRESTPSSQVPPKVPVSLHSTSKRPKAGSAPPSREEVEDDVRAMEQETASLRQTPRAHNRNHSTTVMEDSSFVLRQSESPQITRNKKLRNDATSKASGSSSQPAGSSRQNGARRSSGPRKSLSSLQADGILTQPHSSVDTRLFHKYIDQDFPEPERIRQLFIWCISRATPQKASGGMKTESLEILKRTMERCSKKLVEKEVDLSFSPSEAGGSGLKPNEHNVNNRRWEAQFTEDQAKMEEEDNTWNNVKFSCDELCKKWQAQLDKRRAALKAAQSSRSAKAKGKQRASAAFDDSSGELQGHDAPPDIRRLLAQAQEVLGKASSPSESHRKSYSEAIEDITKRMTDLNFNVDQLHSYVNSARAITSAAERSLDHRHALLSAQFRARTEQPPPNPYPSDSQTGSRVLSTYIPREGQYREFRELLRALSRIDVERPPGQIGDSARRADRDVRRAESNGAGAIGERRLTDVVVPLGPSTPRKTPGTPRSRGGTPGREAGSS